MMLQMWRPQVVDSAYFAYFERDEILVQFQTTMSRKNCSQLLVELLVAFCFL